MGMGFYGWLELVLRWGHVFAGILWVGATYYFTWLDGRFVELEKKAGEGANAEKYVWMVHSGGFYLVERQKRPQLMSQTLHWFKWEAALTWLTGILLFTVLYYRGGLLVNGEDPPLENKAAVWLSIGMLIAGWLAYDFTWNFCKSEPAGVILCYGLIVASAWTACHYFSGRGAYLQVGAMMGTIMAANVWMRILPAQRRMVAALREGREPDLREGMRAKSRSKHNSFIVVPVVFTMISNHYFTLYGDSRYNWVYLSLMVPAGWLAAKIIRRA